MNQPDISRINGSIASLHNNEEFEEDETFDVDNDDKTDALISKK